MNATFNIELRDIDSITPYDRNPRLNDNAVEYKKDYLVFCDGRVFSKRNHRFLKPRNHTHGYLRLQIQRKDEYIHRIVATCFLEKPPDLKEINHIDGNKRNNHVNNLEWCTRSHNNKHAFETGLRDYAELKAMSNNDRAMAAKRKRRKHTPSEALKIWELIQTGMSDCKVAKSVGTTKSVVYNIRKGKAYKEITNGSTNHSH